MCLFRFYRAVIVIAPKPMFFIYVYFNTANNEKQKNTLENRSRCMYKCNGHQNGDDNDIKNCHCTGFRATKLTKTNNNNNDSTQNEFVFDLILSHACMLFCRIFFLLQTVLFDI